MKKLLLIPFLFLLGCSTDNKKYDLLIVTSGKCIIYPKSKLLGNSFGTNIESFYDSYGNKFVISNGKITVLVDDNRWEAAASELKINLSDCGRIL